MPKAPSLERAEVLFNEHRYASADGTCRHADTWRVWVNTAYSTTASVTGSTIISAGTSSTTGSIVFADSVTHIWNNWVVYEDTVGVESRVRQAARVVSEEERQRWRERERLLEAQAAEARAARQAAEERAEALLRSILTPQQREELKSNNRFFLHVGEKRYRVDRGQHGNVKLVDAKDQVIESYCIQPSGGLPNADAMAAQLLLLETDEQKFLRVANVSDRTGRLIRRGMQA